ncbi:MAG: hypothetical protein JOY77_10470 [Alphaproteobacteria bacterium]|nr:hypothetical protein [Alphaproteobacteria bacterium]
MLSKLRSRRDRSALVKQLCADLTERARAPVFFLRLGVPDTLDGRFDLVALHAWIVLDAVNTTQLVRQALIDELFLSFEEGLRGLGTGDLGMNRRLKIVAGAFYGRLQAYRSATNLDALAAAIYRNLYRGRPGLEEPARAIAVYALDAKLCVTAANGRLDFGPLPLI